MKRTFLKFLISLFLILIPMLSSAQDKIVLATVENLPPFSFYQNQVLTGLDMDMIKEIQKRLNWILEIKTLPWVRVLEELKAGTVDGAFSLYEVQERKTYGDYVEIIHYDNLGMMVMRGNEFNFRGIPDLYGKTIGKGAGVFISSEFDQAVLNKKIEVQEINDTQMANIRKLHLGRVDVVIGVVETLIHYRETLNFAEEMVVINSLIERARPGYLVISKKSVYATQGEFLDKLRKTILEIRNDGTYEKLKAKYHVLLPGVLP
ncbi:MAG: hypothetical protein A2Z96_06425 [Spirochaetes bacterium GWB1_48_6]|nr:MAG: hypothetical protein A2Z96_06425 [Spirochaetes bacterium GWB1_48_6]